MALVISTEALVSQYQNVKGELRAFQQRAQSIIAALDAAQSISWDLILELIRDVSSITTKLDAAQSIPELNAIAQEQEGQITYDFLAEAALTSAALKAIRDPLVAGEFPRTGTTPLIYNVNAIAEITTDTVAKTAIPLTHAAIVAALATLG